MAMLNSALEFLATKYGNVVKYDEAGNPSIFVRFPKMKSVDLDSSLPDHVHPAFIINGVEQDAILLGKFKAAELQANGTLYSLPNVPPRVSLGMDPFLERMRAFGGGVSGKTVADSGFLLLLAKKNGWVPKGNNSYSVDYRDGTPWKTAEAVTADSTKRVLYGWEYLCKTSHTTSAELRPDLAPKYWEKKKFIGGETVKSQRGLVDEPRGYNTLNGSGPLSWYLGNDPGNLADIVGNCFEQDYGYRLVDCELQILENNNAADPEADLSANSAAWKAILPNTSDDGYTLVAPGTTGTLHWTWANSKITLDNVAPTFDNEYRGTSFSALGVNSTNVPYVPHILKELGLFPISGDTTQGSVGVRFAEGEYVPRRGGNYSNTSGAGLGYEYCYDVRGNASASCAGRPRSLETP
ncbi:MAG: hypothetical protein PHI27_06460 [Eubacteriales bacterium]|nr:hypothetical protein [Eubacteriales bacterium]MDD3881877.1 hypothetical protein [Eubacteriales bacterium]MDD4512877.1 hypothetical protein [Eubacteriales bacterium]